MTHRGGRHTESVDHGEARGGGDLDPVPGLLLAFSMGRPCFVVLPMRQGTMEVGRGEGTAPLPSDPKMSRCHARVSFDGQSFQITDLGSHNGSFVDGVRIHPSVTSATARVLRTGDSIFLLSADVRALLALSIVQKENLVLGPSMQAVLAQAACASQFGRTLHITGESGSGKEGVARAFHAESPLAKGPFVALNCATIASGVAERLLFGAKRGAFSGAVTDSEGLVQSADGGTLFLDEIAELDLAVQAKLLRVLESGEVLPMGALRPRHINIQLCSASHRDLRAEVGDGRFREDLYFRTSRPEIVVPPLRQRLEEIPWLVERVLLSFPKKLSVYSTFVEACLLRHWPGNVRELLAETRAAAQRALGLGASRLEAQHLDPRAGVPIRKSPEPALLCVPPGHPPIVRPPGPPERERIEEALERARGNISAAARALGLHRTQLTRLMEKLGISASRGSRSIDQELEE